LLLNLPASAELPTGEYVPPEFRAVAVPTYLQQARDLLFGARPDAAMLDYRLRQYMAMLHATELAEFVVAADPRITYTAGDRAMADFGFAPAVIPIGHDRPLFIGGDRPTAAGGRMAYAWQVTILVAGQPGPTAAVTRRSPTPGSAEHPIGYDGDLSTEFPLDGSPLLARSGGGVVADGTTWNVGCLAPPGRDPGQVAADFAAAGGAILGGLFAGGAAEPYATWAALWESAQPLPYRLGAILLAVAARTDDIRRRLD
jgi:hypothetical protein